ncbi:uncharacterized protein B0H64DRAFT_353693 [Chaetomium fimeti]|uniref:Uncharacterized protein n=1 Tax=Chaetomium fimeti TaxID=1854472 RepID=A0AAE0HKF9_9PEZI|nr:hypothetical protein B0H64DRAFT_353693 [Chaetomium fimeti]
MDSASLLSDSAIDLSTGIGAKRPPTYTTVGSVYNPKTTTPLQPPTRRPRTRRYPQPIRSPPEGTFMNALLSALPIEDQNPPSPPSTASILRQYSPLQQNYDRAAIPVSEQETMAFTEFDMSMTNVRSGDLPSPTGFESNDSVAAEDTLTSRITVKGLTNLASYPNPMQKAARNTLARARAVNLSLSRPGTPSSLPSTTPDMFKDRLFNTYGAKPAMAGPPQPLKAGPPGQRAFKPTTLDAAARSLRIEDQVPPAMYQSRSPIGFQYNPDTNIQAAFDDDDGIHSSKREAQLPLEENQHGPVSRNPHDVTGFGGLLTPGPFDTFTESLDGAKRKVHDTLPPERIKHYFPGGFPSSYDGRHKPMGDDWATKQPAPEDGFRQESFSERMTKINRNFYAGTEGLVKNLEQIVRDHNYRCLENKIGVIGGERERLRGSHIERLGADGKVQPPILSVDEVDKMSEADVAKPLVNMAFATLLSYKEQSESGASGQNAWPSGFTKPDDSWVDATVEGNTSFFSKPKEECLKRKKAHKKVRRGY